jgi:hypothetical protein
MRAGIRGTWRTATRVARHVTRYVTIIKDAFAQSPPLPPDHHSPPIPTMSTSPSPRPETPPILSSKPSSGPVISEKDLLLLINAIKSRRKGAEYVVDFPITSYMLTNMALGTFLLRKRMLSCHGSMLVTGCAARCILSSATRLSSRLAFVRCSRQERATLVQVTKMSLRKLSLNSSIIYCSLIASLATNTLRHIKFSKVFSLK